MTAKLTAEYGVSVDGKSASAELQRLTGELSKAKQELYEQQRAVREGEAAWAKAKTAFGATSVEALRLRDALVQERSALIQATAQHGAAATALDRLSQSQTRAATSAGAMRAASLNLGAQVNDIAQGLALGVPVMTIFAQQGGQVAGAMAGMGGGIGRVATILSGPWGAALTGAALILTPFVAKLFDSGKASDAAAEATRRQKQALEEFENLVRRSAQTQEQVIQRNIAEANSRIKAAEATRVQIRAALDEQIAAQKKRGFTFSPSGGVVADTIGLAAGRAEIADLERRRAENEAQIGSDQRKVNGGQALLGLQRVREATDAVAAANGRYQRTEAALVAQREQGRISQKQYEEQLLKATTARDAAIKAAQESTRADAKALREQAAEARAAAKAMAELLAAADKGRVALGNDPRFSGQGILDAAESRERAARDRSRPDDMLGALMTRAEALRPALDQLGQRFGEQAGDAFASQALTQAVAMGQAIGGAIGGALQSAAGVLQGLRTGNFTGVSGSVGGTLTLLSGLGRMGGTTDNIRRANAFTPAQIRAAQASGQTLEGPGTLFGQGFNQVFTQPLKKIGDGLQSFVGKLGGDFPKLIGKAAGGAAIGSAVSGLANAVGIRMSQTGSQIGGALGGLIPGLGPLGGLVGSVLGGVLGNLLGRTPRGSTTVSSSGGNITQSSAGDQAIQKATGAMGNSISNAISTIAEQLGGTIGDFAVSIGREGNRFRVDTAGRGRTKKNGRDVVGFAEDEAAALQFALADAIRDGAIKTSPRVQAALNRYADDVNKAVAEALKVRNLEDLLANRQNPFFSVFRDLELQIRQRNDVARQNGFDLAEIEKINGEQREAAVRDTLSRTTGSIRQLLNDLQFGSRATGSVAERLAGLTAERDRVAGLARAGDTGQLDTLASLVQQIDDLQREAFGSTSPFAAGRSESISLLNELVTQTEARINAAADDARKATETTNAKLTEANASLDDLVAGQARQTAAIEMLVRQLAGFGGGGSEFALSAEYVR